jgi:hypothetical protein
MPFTYELLTQADRDRIDALNVMVGRKLSGGWGPLQFEIFSCTRQRLAESRNRYDLLVGEKRI